MKKRAITICIDPPDDDYYDPTAWYVRDDHPDSPFEGTPYATEKIARVEAEARQAYFLVHGWAVSIETY